MRIAFVGKGGSGKSTVSALFTNYLQNKNLKNLVIDADLNIHIPHLLNISYDKSKALSLNENVGIIRKYLKGSNERISDISEMYKTTPPARGSQLIEIDEDNEILSSFSEKFDENSYFMFVGTYESGEIGRSCYHTNLSIFENILSHLKLTQDEWVVTDMVAGIDAFSNTLHAQFDAIVLVVEPSLESIEVFNQYREMLQVSGNYDDLLIVANKIEDDEDLTFIQDNVDAEKLIGHFEVNTNIKKARQRGKKITLDLLTKKGMSTLDAIFKSSLSLQKSPDELLKRLHKLHLKYIDQDYVKLAVGDISNQIDAEFTYE